MGTGSGYGKVILFGEHFVVHGNHSVVSAINMSTTANVEEGKAPGVELVDNRPAAPGYKEAKMEHQKKSIGYILEVMKIDPASPLKITLAGDLYAASGVGSSAASCTAMARALNDHFSMGMSDEQINQAAWEGERGYHGNPSGVDNTASTFGGLLWFLRKPEGNEFEKITVPKKYYIVMANSGPTANTKAAVAKVKTLKEEKPEFYLDIAIRAENAAVEGRRALEKGDEKNAGLLMNINHTLLQEAGVSTPLLDIMVETARASGALGAKLTGGGLGGYMVALVPDPEVQKRVAESIKSLDGAITTLLTTIG